MKTKWLLGYLFLLVALRVREPMDIDEKQKPTVDNRQNESNKRNKRNKRNESKPRMTKDGRAALCNARSKGEKNES